MHKSTELNMFQYAHDSTIDVIGDFLESMIPLVNLEFVKIISGLCANKLSLYVYKSLFTVFSSTTLTYYPRLFIRGKYVPYENKIKLLGAIIINKLHFSDHIGVVCTIIRRSLGFIKKTFSFSTKNCFAIIIIYFVNPHVI